MARKGRQFHNDWYDWKMCLICYEVREMVSFHQHSTCEECLRDYIAFKVSNTGRANLICPIKDCLVELPSSFTAKYCPTELLPSFKRYQERDELMNNPYVKFCPEPDCEGYDLSDSKKNLTCRTCGHHYCAYCQEPWHSSLCKNALDQQFERWAFWSNVKHCPSCGFRIEKDGGCPHIICSRCNTGFCWYCGLEDSEHSKCVFFSEQLKNPDWLYIAGLVLSPLTFLLTFVILYNFIPSQVRTTKPYSWLGKVGYFLLTHTYLSNGLLLLLTPLLWICVPLFVTLTLAFTDFKYSWPWLFWLQMAIVTILGYPVLIAIILLVVLLAIPVGLGYTVWKVIILAVKFRNPGFMKSQIRLGF